MDTPKDLARLAPRFLDLPGGNREESGRGAHAPLPLLALSDLRTWDHVAHIIRNLELCDGDIHPPRAPEEARWNGRVWIDAHPMRVDALKAFVTPPERYNI